MPREIVHWIVVQNTASALASRNLPLINDCIASYPAAAFLGAISHDVPYYYRMGEDQFELVADVMHGREGEDTLLPMRMLALQILTLEPEKQKPLWSFFFGMLTHIATDVQIHPIVYYFTGNYHDPDPAEAIRAQGRHRLFETYLDWWARPKAKFPFGISLRDLLREDVASRKLICEELEKVLVPEMLWKVPAPSELGRWFHGMSQMAWYQHLFLSTTVGALFRGVASFGSDRTKSIDSLFSFGRRGSSKFFDKPFEYLHPVSGEAHTASAEELMGRSVDDSIQLIERFESVIGKDTGALTRALEGVVGSSLNYGVPNAPTDLGKYFSVTGAPLPGLER